MTGALLLLLAAAQPQDRFPGASWEARAPVEAGMDAARLEEALEYAGGALGGASRCVSVHRHGYLVAERYYEGDAASRHITWSTSKAAAATLVGAAERLGQLRHDQVTLRACAVSRSPLLSGGCGLRSSRRTLSRSGAAGRRRA